MKFTKEFRNVRKLIKTDPTKATQMLNTLQELVRDNRTNMLSAIINQRVAAPINERKLNITVVDSNSTKFTINPINGQCRLKLSYKCSEKVKFEILTFIRESVMFFPDFENVTFRGKITWHKGFYKTCLSSESKYFHHHFSIQG